MAVQWPLLIFSVLLGASSGIMVFLGIGEVKGRFKAVRFPLALIALILLALGGIASVFHLGHADRAFYILGNLNSGLSRELFAVGFLGIVTLVYMVLARKDYPGPSKVFGILGLIGGIVLPVVAGSSLMMPARPAWDSFTLPLMYLGTGLGMGFVLSAAYVYLKGSADERRFAFQLAGIGILCSIATSLFYIVWIAMAPFGDPTRSLARLAAGDLALSFWLCVVLVGMVAPAALYFLVRKDAEGGASDSPAVAGVDADGTASASGTAKLTAANALWVSLACLVVGNVVLRVIMYAVATSVEHLIY